MLNMGFREDIELVLDRLHEDRQTILFSATMPPAILQLTKRYQKNPEFVKIQNKEVTTNTIGTVLLHGEGIHENGNHDAINRHEQPSVNVSIL